MVNTMLVTAIRTRDLRRIASLIDLLRAHGMRYPEVAQLACKAGGIDEAEWESLCYEADTAEGDDAPR
jgi:hypothetical protein